MTQIPIIKASLRVLFRLLADRSLTSQGDVDQPHIFLPRWDSKLGDAIVSSFFLRELMKLGCKVTVATTSALVALHRDVFGVEQVIEVSGNPNLTELACLARKLENVDVVVHLVGKLQPNEIVFIWMLRPKKFYSLDESLRCVNKKMGVKTAHMNIVEQYQYVLEDLGASSINCNYTIPFPEILPERQTAPDILFNPWGSRSEKSLSTQCAVETLREIATSFHDLQIGILNSPITHAESFLMAKEVGCQNVKHLPGINLPSDAVGYLCHAQVVISVDTAIVHLAVGLKKPLIAIYPEAFSSPNPWLPPKSETTVVLFSKQIEASTKAGKKNMNNFSRSDLLDAISGILAASVPNASVLSIDAKVVSGLAVAKRTLARQLPLIAEDFPEVQHCFHGTINLVLERPLKLIKPDHRTKPIAWTPSGNTLEVFDLLRIEIETEVSPVLINAWLYVAYNSPHREDPSTHEIIAPYIPLRLEQTCKVYIREDAVELL